MSVPARDLFGLSAAALPAKAGLRLLARSPPAAWPTDRLALWPTVVDRALAFERCWGDQARSVGWTELDLYGLHQRAPWPNLSAMGAVFLVAIGGHAVIRVNAEAIEIAVQTTGSRLRIVRRPPDPASVLAWQLPANVR